MQLDKNASRIRIFAMFEWHIFDRNLLQLAIECHVLFWKLYSQLKRIPTPFLEVLWLRPKKKKKKKEEQEEEEEEVKDWDKIDSH
jgi:hypothetical protein